jgi:hypothetical protein
MPLHALHRATGVALVPSPIEVLRDGPELHQNVGEVFRLDLAPLLAPQAQQSGLIVVHDCSGIGTTDEISSTR